MLNKSSNGILRQIWKLECSQSPGSYCINQNQVDFRYVQKPPLVKSMFWSTEYRFKSKSSKQSTLHWVSYKNVTVKEHIGTGSFTFYFMFFPRFLPELFHSSIKDFLVPNPLLITAPNPVLSQPIRGPCQFQGLRFCIYKPYQKDQTPDSVQHLAKSDRFSFYAPWFVFNILIAQLSHLTSLYVYTLYWYST